MGQVFVFHGSADAAAARAVAAQMEDQRPLLSPLTALVGRVEFGPQVRVVVAWSHAAADEAAASVRQNMGVSHAVLLMDDVMAPAGLFGNAPQVRATGDAAADAAALRQALKDGVSVRAVASAPASKPLAPRRPVAARAPAPRPATAMTRAESRVPRSRSRGGLGLVAGGSAFGAMIAVIFGWAVPSQLEAAPVSDDASAATTEIASSQVAQAAARAQSFSARAEAEALLSDAEMRAVAFTASEEANIEAALTSAEESINAARSWADGAVDRLSRMATRNDFEPVLRGRQQTVEAEAVEAEPVAGERVHSLAIRGGAFEPTSFEHAVNLLADASSTTDI